MAAGKQLRVLYRQAQANDDVNDFNLEILKSCLNKLIIIEALVTLIVVYNLSYCLAEWLAFYVLCLALNLACKGIIITSYLRIRNIVCASYTRHKDTIRRLLQSALLRIYIACDI